jgi:methylmalonyl-CoA/ethylmalonyl-CoA epimerase
MNIKNIDHIGIAVNDIESALNFYRDALGLKLEEIEVVEEQKVKVAFLPISGGEFELLETTEQDGPIARHIEKNGEGIHHIALRVENLEESLAELKSKGIRLIDEKPRKGAGGAKIAFLHPKSTGGVLLELCER